MRATNTGTLLADGTFEGTLELLGDGTADGRLRSILSRRRLSEIRGYLANLLHYVSDRVELIGYEHGDILDFKTGMWWKINYRIPEYALPVDSGLEFKSPLMQITSKSRMLFGPVTYDWPEKRRDDVFFYTTQLLIGTETIRLPKGFKVTEPPKSDEVDETYAYFKGESEMTKKGLAISQRAEIKRRQIPPDGYDCLRKAMKEARKYAGTVFRAEKGGAK